MAFDDILISLGEFGPYQRRIYVLLCLTTITSAMHKLAGVFLQAKANHRCELPFEDDNATYNLPSGLLNMSMPIDDITGKWSSCRMLNANFTDEYFENRIPANQSIPCQRWIYDKSKYSSSVVMEFDLVCDNAWLRAAGDSTFMVGVLIGSIVFGSLSDRYGRKPMFFLALVMQVAFGLIAAVIPNYISFMIARMIVGATTSGVFLVGYVLGMEMVGPSKRTVAGVVCQYFAAFGYLLTALFAFFISNWRYQQAAITVTGVVFLAYWWIIPESTRWLLTKGHSEEAKTLILKVAKENKASVPKDILEDLITDSKKKQTEQSNTSQSSSPSILDLVRTPNMRRKSLFIFFNWFVNSGTYYGLSWNTSNLGGNDFINFVIAGAVEIPAYTFLLLTLNRWGRKTILCSTMLLGGLALLLTIAVPNDMHWLLITLAMIGKLGISASYGTIYIFSAEQFPTVIRNVGLGASSMCARIGGILAPYINLLADHWQHLPLLIFGSLAFLGGFMALMLPETLNKKLPDTVEEGENFGKESVREAVVSFRKFRDRMNCFASSR